MVLIIVGLIGIALVVLLVKGFVQLSKESDIKSKELDEQLAKYDTDALSEEEIEDLIDSLSISHYLDGEIDYKDIIIAFSHVDVLQ